MTDKQANVRLKDFAVGTKVPQEVELLFVTNVTSVPFA
jgi:hypothetical protein